MYQLTGNHSGAGAEGAFFSCSLPALSHRRHQETNPLQQERNNRERPDLSGAVNAADTSVPPCEGHIRRETLGLAFVFLATMFHRAVGALRLSRVNHGARAVVLFLLVLNEWILISWGLKTA